MFGPNQIPRHDGPPASSRPLADYLDSGELPGVDQAGYAVLPRSLAEAMPLPWQQQMTALLADFHSAFGHLQWPVYKVVPSRAECLVDLDEEQLAEVGMIVELDPDGDLVYRERGGRRVPDPENTTVLVSCLDPIPTQQNGGTAPKPRPADVRGTDSRGPDPRGTDPRGDAHGADPRSGDPRPADPHTGGQRPLEPWPLGPRTDSRSTDAYPTQQHPAPQAYPPPGHDNGRRWRR